MQLLCPINRDECITIRIADGDESAGRIGGTPPQGIFPGRLGLRYFASIKVASAPELWASIFVDEAARIRRVSGQVNELGLIDVVVHSPALGTSDSELTSSLSAHGLQTMSIVKDVMDTGEGELVPLSGHKIGGRPYFIRPSHGLHAAIRDFDDQRFMLVVQMDFPGHEDAEISGDWPFSDGIFSLWGREPFGPSDWRWYFDF